MKYEFDVSKLTGEEMLTFGECLIDIITFDNADSDICEIVERSHEKKYNFYCEHHPEYRKGSYENYDDDKAWMFAEGAVITMLLNNVNNEKIDNFFNCGNDFYDEQKEIWDKVVTAEEVEQSYDNPYSCCDRYDFTMCRH